MLRVRAQTADCQGFLAIRDDVGPTPPINYHRPYLNTTEQGLRDNSPRSADHTQAQYPSDHERETRSIDYNPYDIQQPFHISRQTTQSGNSMSSESPQNRTFNVVNPSQSRQGSIDLIVPSVIVQSDTDPSSGLRRTPSFVQRQIIEIENATSQIGHGRIVRSHSFATSPTETKDKDQGKRYSFDSGRMALLAVSSEARSHTQLPTNNQFQDQIESEVHGNPTFSSFSPNPVISTGKPDISAEYPDISAGKPYISDAYPTNPHNIPLCPPNQQNIHHVFRQKQVLNTKLTKRRKEN